MALRARLTLMSAVIVGVTLVLASLVAYAAVRGQQRGQVDDARAADRQDGPVSRARPRASAAPAATRSSCDPTATRSSSARPAARSSP
jgi:hypothetical protein